MSEKVNEKRSELFEKFVVDFRNASLDLPNQILEDEIRFFIHKTGEKMQRENIPGYMHAVSDVYDRAAYGIFRPMFDKTIEDFFTFIFQELDDTFGSSADYHPDEMSSDERHIIDDDKFMQ